VLKGGDKLLGTVLAGLSNGFGEKIHSMIRLNIQLLQRHVGWVLRRRRGGGEG
jgi:hypothetical protein